MWIIDPRVRVLKLRFVHCCLSGFDMLQTRGTEQLLPAEDATVWLWQHSIPPSEESTSGEEWAFHYVKIEADVSQFILCLNLLGLFHCCELITIDQTSLTDKLRSGHVKWGRKKVKCENQIQAVVLFWKRWDISCLQYLKPCQFWRAQVSRSRVSSMMLPISRVMWTFSNGLFVYALGTCEQ